MYTCLFEPYVKISKTNNSFKRLLLSVDERNKVLSAVLLSRRDGTQDGLWFTLKFCRVFIVVL